MRGAKSYGPSLVVLAASVAALFAAPVAVKQFVNAQTTADMTQASGRLNGAGNILAEINAVQRDIAKAVEPSVVHVSTAGVMHGNSVNRTFVQSGSGWVWDDRGYIVTNAHVIEGADRWEVQLNNGELREAKPVGRDIRTDIAVLKIASGDLHPSKRGDSDSLQQGDLVYAFGSPFDFRFSMSSGIVSGLGRTAGPEEIDYQNFIQVDAAINPGNSGGPLTNIQGQVVGMNTAIATGRGNSVGQGQFAGIGLAIPMSMIETVVNQIIDTGDVKKGYLGVQVNSPEEAALVAADEPPLRFVVDHYKGEGAVVTTVEPKSPAGLAGLRLGDVVVAIDGRRVTDRHQVPAIISSKRPGTEVTLDLWRADLASGKSKNETVKVTLGELDVGERYKPLTQDLKRLGFLKLSTSTDQRCREMHVPYVRGVLVEDVQEGSELSSVVPKGSVIVDVLGQPIESEDELYAKIETYRRRLQNASGNFEPIVAAPITAMTPTGEPQRVNIPLRIR